MTLDNVKAQSFDSVLCALKNEDFNAVYDIALSASEDESQLLLDRIKASLVAARFAYLHNLIERACELIQRIPPLLEKFGKITNFSHLNCIPPNEILRSQ